jgi:1-deoxy-D-xylulose-5-phosphate reductoisomerase
LDLALVGQLEFGPLDDRRFPAFGLARQAIAAGDSYPTAYSIADELAVGAFLRGEIGFSDIARMLALTLEHHSPVDVSTLDAVLGVVAEEERRAKHFLSEIARARGR